MVGYVFVVSTIVALMVLGSLLKEKKTAFNSVILAGMVMVSIWLICDTVPYFIPSPYITGVAFRLKVLMTIILPVVIYWFVIIYSGYSNNWKKHMVFMISPIISTMSWATNSFPYPFVNNVLVTYDGYVPTITFHPELGFEIYMIYAYILTLLSVGILIYRAFRGPRTYRVEAIRVAFGLILALMGNGLTLWLFADVYTWENNAADMTSVFVFVFFAVVYITSMRSGSNHEDRVMQMTMSEGLRRDEFTLLLQPQYMWNGEQYEVKGAEALIRWIREGEVYKRPDQFIPVAERNGMILPIGNWVVDEIFRINRSLYNKGVKTKLSINVSAIQLQSKSFIKHLDQVMEEYKDIPIDLVIELTESSLMEHEEMVVENLNTIKSKGIQIALGDFGTGYSSLSYLQQLPIDYLKIDKSFVDEVHKDTKSLTPYILDIAKNLELQTIAEGTEIIEQVDVLKGRCDYFQGYYFSKPLPEADFVMSVWGQEKR